MKKWLFILLIINWFDVFGQKSIIDSLKQEALISSDTTLSIIYGELFWNFTLQSELDSALKYANLEKSTAEKIKWEKGIAQGHNDIGIIYYYLTKYDKALMHYNLSLESRRKMNDLYGIGALYNKIGLIHQEKGKYSEFVYTQLEALRIFKTLKDTMNYAKTLNNLADAYFQLRDYETAKKTYREAIKLRLLINDKEGLAASYLNLGNCYSNSEEALVILNKALDLLLDLNLTLETGYAHHNIAINHKQLGNLEKALIHINEAIKIKEKHGSLASIADTYMAAGDIFRQNKEYKKAFYYLKEAEKISEERGIHNNFEFLYHYLASYYFETGKIDSAYYYEKKCVEVKNQFFQEKMYNHVAGMQVKYEVEKKNTQLAENKQELTAARNEILLAQLHVKNRNFWLVALGLTLLLVILLSVLLVQRQRNKLALEKSQAVITERDRGTLALVDAQEEERIRIAKELHDGVGNQLLALHLKWNSIVKKINLNDGLKQEFETGSKMLKETMDEVRSVSHQMMPKVLSEFGLIPAVEEMLQRSLSTTTIKYLFDSQGVNQKLDKKLEVAIYRVLQELINNVIKHSNATEVQVQLFSNLGYLILILEDNGKGMPADKKSTDGIGLTSIQSRLHTIDGEFSITPGPYTGTLVTIRIPIK
jgi:signal transduction histidine kinase